MPARSIKQILQYEIAIQEAWRSVLKKGGVTESQIFTQFSPNSAITPRVELNLTSVVPTYHRGAVLPGIFTFDAWHGQLITRVVTRRSLNPDQHDELLAIVRMQALYFRDQFTADVLPWHVMTQIEEHSTHRMIESDRDEDITEVTHKVLFSVRQGVFPLTEI